MLLYASCIAWHCCWYTHVALALLACLGCIALRWHPISFDKSIMLHCIAFCMLSALHCVFMPCLLTKHDRGWGPLCVFVHFIHIELCDSASLAIMHQNTWLMVRESSTILLWVSNMIRGVVAQHFLANVLPCLCLYSVAAKGTVCRNMWPIGYPVCRSANNVWPIASY